MFYLYLQSSSASRQPKISNLMFFANPVYRVLSHANAWHLKTFQWHGWHGPQLTPYFSLKYTNFLLENILPSFIIFKHFYEVKKFQRCPFRWPCTQIAERSKRDTNKIFTGHGLRLTKRPGVWYFSIFLFEKYKFLLEIFYLNLESSSASRKWKNLNVVRAFLMYVENLEMDNSLKWVLFIKVSGQITSDTLWK